MTTSVRNAYGYALTSPGGNSRVRNVVGYALTDPDPTTPNHNVHVDYRKVRTELMLDLIEQANPGIKNSLSASDIALDTVLALPAGGYADTSVRTTGAPASTRVIGSKVLTYRRVDIGKVYKGQTLTVNKWLPVNTLTRAEFIELFLAQYGLRFDPLDLSFTTLSVGVATAVTVVSTSVCWKGTITVTWQKGKRNISEFAGDRVLKGRNWPQSMIDFQDGSKPQGELMLYHLDYSAIRTQLLGWTHGTTYAAGSTGATTVATALNTQATPALGFSFTNADILEKPGLGGIQIFRYALPNAAIPEANSAEFSWCIVIIPTSPSWFFGRLIAHFN